MATVLAEERGIDAAGADSPGLVSDCRLMLSFARKNGFVLPPSLVHEIAWLDSVLKALQMPPVSQMSTRLIWAIDLDKGAPRYLPADPGDQTPPAAPLPLDAGQAPEEVILDVHARLSTLIAPTTALSLQTSEPPAGKRHIFGGMPPLVQYVIVIAFIAAFCFVVTASRIASKSVNARASAAQAASAAAASSAPSAPSPPARASAGAKP
jgi:hypothetical protein